MQRRVDDRREETPPFEGQVLIVGTGGNGISAAVHLLRAGITDFRMISRSTDFGGTWHENRYPGLEVDIPSQVYQFSYARNPDWSALFATQPELLDYMKKVAADHGLSRYTTFETEMVEASWDEQGACWMVRTTRGGYRARYLVVATGFLDEPRFPNIRGISDFRGRIFHSARWPSGYVGHGERVAVIGSGASAIQIVPELQKHAQQLVAFQRTPTWILPKNNHAISQWKRRLFRTFPWLHALHCELIFRYRSRNEIVGSHYKLKDGFELMELAKDFLRTEVLDPALREQLTPKHHYGCKRPLFSNDYLRSLTRPNVVVADAAALIGPDFVEDATGKRFAVDAIVLTTGFEWGDSILSRIKRRDGVTVAEYQGGWPRAYKAISVAGCPNLFLFGGAAPNGQRMSGLLTGEAAAGYVVKSIAYVEGSGCDAIEVKEDVELEWKRRADAILDNGPTVRGGCFNYSQDERGHNKAAWPGSPRNMVEELSTLDVKAYAAVRKAKPASKAGERIFAAST